MKRKLTKQDLKKTLSELGFKEGDELILPSSAKPNANEQSESNEGDEGQGTTTTTPPTGGPNPPPDKERP